MLTRRERGADAAWLREARKSRWSNAHAAVDAFRDATGHTIHYSRWAAYESGAKPIRDEDMDALVAYFGDGPVESASTDSDLAAAIREQTAAIDRLVAAMTQDRKDGPPWVDALVAALRASPAGSGNGGSDGPQGSAALRQGR